MIRFGHAGSTSPPAPKGRGFLIEIAKSTHFNHRKFLQLCEVHRILFPRLSSLDTFGSSEEFVGCGFCRPQKSVNKYIV